MCDCNKQAQPERKPHVHADVIKAWAEGYTVQVCRRGSWVDCSTHPLFEVGHDYRIKPEPKPLTDLEKYGVEVGDVWLINGHKQVVHSVQQDRIFTGGYAVTVLGVDARFGMSNNNFNTILFRRGVVNKL